MIIGILEIQSVSHKICLLTLKLDSSVFYCIIFFTQHVNASYTSTGRLDQSKFAVRIGLVWWLNVFVFNGLMHDEKSEHLVCKKLLQKVCKG